MNIVSNRLLQDWLQSPKATGCDLKNLLNASGIPWHFYDDSRAHISGEQLGRLSVQIRRALNDQFMGYGRNLLLPALLDRVLIKILAQAKNLREVLFEWKNFYNLVQNTGTILTDSDTNELIYRFAFDERQRPGTHVWVLDITMLKLQLFSWMIGKRIKLKAIGFAEPPPASAGEYAALLSVEVRFDQSCNFFVIDGSHLHCPVIRTAEECLSYRDYLPEDFFVIPGDDRRFVRLVEKAVKDRLRLESRLPGIDGVAEQLSVSVRSLRRRLESEGESFQHLKDKIRHEIAVKRLAGNDVPIADIAVDLGFSGAVAFCRAFKSWTDSTPQEYRSRYFGR